MKKRYPLRWKRPEASDSGAAFAQVNVRERDKEEREERKPLTQEERRRIMEEESLASRENIKRLRQEHEEYLKSLKPSVN